MDDMDKVINFVCAMPASGKMTVGFERVSPTVLLAYAQVDGARFYEPAGTSLDDRAKALERVTARIAAKDGKGPENRVEVKVEGGKF
jgi:hypothetical protein